MSSAAQIPGFVGSFLRAEPKSLHDWIAAQQSRLVWFSIIAIVFGAGIYGAAMGCWSSGLQALYTGIKLPLVILLTTAGNGLLNGMLAPLLGLNIGFRQSFVIVLVSFAIASLILGALAPVALFLVWNTPPLSAVTRLISPEYNFLQLTLAVFIAVAGTMANVQLLPLLREWSRNRNIARNVLFAWLACNLFLGSQICWVLRPFIWEPGTVKFIGAEYLHGSFFETVFEAMRRLIF